MNTSRNVTKPQDPMLGRVVAGRYRLEARAGEGGMRVVYRARHVLIDRVVARKLIRPDLRGETHLRVWTLREARAALSSELAKGPMPLARAVDILEQMWPRSRVPTTSASFTATVLGTPDYMSPVQARGEEAGPPSDLHARGVLFFEMLTGQLPSSSNDRDKLLEMQRSAPPPKPSASSPTRCPRPRSSCSSSSRRSVASAIRTPTTSTRS